MAILFNSAHVFPHVRTSARLTIHRHTHTSSSSSDPPLIDNHLVVSIASIKNSLRDAHHHPLDPDRPQLYYSVEPAEAIDRSPPPQTRLDSPAVPTRVQSTMPPMATATATDSAAAARRFAVACGVLSQHVKAAAPAPVPAVDGAAAQQLTTFYGGRVVVLDDCTPARAAKLIRYAAAAASTPEPAPVPSTVVDIPIARKVSLQRFLAKRKDKPVTAAVGPAAYTRWEETAASPPAKKGKTEASSWLALGSVGDVNAP